MHLIIKVPTPIAREKVLSIAHFQLFGIKDNYNINLSEPKRKYTAQKDKESHLWSWQYAALHLGEVRANADTTFLQHRVSIIIAVLQTLHEESDVNQNKQKKL